MASTRKRGQWVAPRLRGRRSTVLMLMFCAAALVRAIDYATGVDGVAATPNSALGGIERAFPLGVWAAALAVGAGLVLVGMFGRWSHIVALGSALLGGVYFGLSVGLSVEYLGQPWLDGIRDAAGLAVPVVWHFIVANHAATLRQALELLERGGRAATG